MSNRARKIAALVIGIVALIYTVSPLDFIPDWITGPLGFADDGVLDLGAIIAIVSLIAGQKKTMNQKKTVN
jgi:uncharacterized membrane protein YkvA (DUF1232 family)